MIPNSDLTTHHSQLGKALLRWYGRCARALPWRGAADPYRVWVSEIMLQQTRTETVKPYFARFLRLFPSVRHLAAAPLSSVLKAWEGLGYYSRARNLHRSAGVVMRDWGGALPGTAAELMAIPGIGRYTAGAIASIAFGRDEPALDGNISRVLCRLLCFRAEPSRPAARERLWQAAGELLPPGRAGEFNQALMDLGATVCVPGRPRCRSCPLEEICQARRAGRQDELPLRRRRAATPHQTIVVGVIRKGGRRSGFQPLRREQSGGTGSGKMPLLRGGRILIARRRAEGLLGGLWEFPGGKVEPGDFSPGDSRRDALCRALRREVMEETGIRAGVLAPLMTIRHAYTHLRITMHVWECRHLAGRARPIACDEVRWVRPAELDRYAWPAANRKVVAALTGRDERGTPAASQ